MDTNGLIIWSECLEEGHDLHDYACEISDPTYSLDILPTLSNLFGLEFDSRLMVGRDVFASNTQPMVVWSNYCWQTEKGYYDVYTEEFYPANDDLKVDQDYIDEMATIASNKIKYSMSCLYNDYYGHLFGQDSLTDSTDLWIEKYGN